MLTGERRYAHSIQEFRFFPDLCGQGDLLCGCRGVSTRRGMTVLGKIPAVPKPINLPSQRLENHGLDPNVEIVPRGSVSWGSAGRSPPTSTGAWGTGASASSPPVSNSTWGSKQGGLTTGSNGSGGGGGAWGGAGTVPRPASAGSGTRPSSAGSIRLGQQEPDTSTANNSSNPPWGPRPTSGPGVQVQTQVQSQTSFSRPRSADTSSRAGPSLSGFGDPSAGPAPAVGSHATGGRLGQVDEPHQASRFKLTRVDFPTLGSEKNPDLRPHPNDGSHTPTGGYGGPERRMPDGWRRDGPPFGGQPALPDGNWQRDGPPPMPSYGGQGLPSDSWRREVPPSGSPLDDNWRRGGAPPIGQYGPTPRGPGGPSHFPHDGAGSMHQPHFGPGSAPYGPSRPGPGGFGRPGDMYANGPLMRPGAPMRPNNMFPGPGPYDAYYGHPGYTNMEDQQRIMSGMGGPGPAGHAGFPFHHGPSFEAYYPRGGMLQGPRHMPPHNFRDRNEGVGEGYNEGPSRSRGMKSEGGQTKDGRGDNEVSRERILPSQDTGESHTSGSRLVTNAGGRDQSKQRVGNYSRELSPSSGASPSTTATGVPAVAAPKPGQRLSSATSKPSVLGTAPHSAIAAGEKPLVETSDLEKQASLTSTHATVIDSNGEMNATKVHILKHVAEGGLESSNSDATLVDTQASDISVVAMTTGNDAKVSLQPKLRNSSHDGEKEWRAKVGPADTSNQLSSSAAMIQVPQPARTATSAVSAVADLSDTAASESETGFTSDYDYEAQRAKMKEIAAQRARQLQKEEEERIREQKAKARAKLEELNRRSTVTPVAPVEEAIVEPQKLSDDSEDMLSEPAVVTLEASPALEAGSSSSQQSGRNEHGKRERDRRLRDRNAKPGDQRKRTDGSVSQPPPLLPSPHVQAAPLLPSPTVEPPVQYPKPHQHSQQRAKVQQKHPAAKVDQAESAAPTLIIDIPTFADNGGWVIHTPPSQDYDAAAAVPSVMTISDGPSASRKKKSNRSRNRQRVEGVASSVETTQVAEPNVTQTLDGSSGSDLPSDSAQAVSHGGNKLSQEPVKDTFHVEEAIFNLSLSDVSTGDGVPVTANGDSFGKRVQRKPQGARHAARVDRVDRLSQDVRVTDKPHANDSMVWAPVRSPVLAEVSKLEAVDDHSSEQKEESSKQQRGRSKRAELERYTPKSVKQQHETLQQSSSPPQRAPILDIPVQQPAPSVVATEVQPILATKDAKMVNESKHAESVSKLGRGHGSWRQRGSSHQDRKGGSGKESLSAPHFSAPSQVQAAHDPRPSEQKIKGVQPPLGHNDPSSEHIVATPEPVPSVSAAVQRPEKEQQAPVLPYQPPRPGSAPGHRGHGNWNAESKGHQERVPPPARSGGTSSDRAPLIGSAGSQHHPRGGGGHHPRQQTQDRELQMHASPNVQVEKQVVSVGKTIVQPTLNEHEQQEQHQPRPAKHFSADGGESGGQRGRSRQEQTARPLTAPQQGQRGQTHWQQTGNQEAYHSQPHLTERNQQVSSHHPRQDALKQVNDSVKLQTGGQQQNKAHHQPLAPLAVAKTEGGPWDGEHGMSSPTARGRDNGHVRRGRFGGSRSSARTGEMDQRREQPIPKQRLVIDATGGALPSQVGG
ncbi:unnamed protein product [Sphagnum troendelagicum]|uniref:BAT2 N-terminal domain-containing protein n=1 Tax=Sphagnum troendelagicum TaxID=128251 RepID=A0ABP0TPP0_9BRYO